MYKNKVFSSQGSTLTLEGNRLAAIWGYLPKYFSGISNYFSIKGYQKAKDLLNTKLKYLMLHRKYRRKVLLPHMNFTNTQLKSANTQ